MAKKRAREADGAAEAPDKMVEDGDSSDDEVSGMHGRMDALKYHLSHRGSDLGNQLTKIGFRYGQRRFRVVQLRPRD